MASSFTAPPATIVARRAPAPTLLYRPSLCNLAPPHLVPARPAAKLQTPLARVYTGVGRRPLSVTPALISTTLKNAVRYLGADLGFLPSDVSARSLRAAGAMALLVAEVDPDIIKILGRWRSEKMFCYLHLSADPIMKDFTSGILRADYTLAPSQMVPVR